MKKVEITPHASYRGVRLKKGAIKKAITTLGIKGPVTIKWCGSWRATGRHAWRNKRHVITVSSKFSSDEVSKTLWHELAHALQMELMGSPKRFEREYSRLGNYGTARYLENRFEIEARQMEECHYEHPLAYTHGR